METEKYQKELFEFTPQKKAAVKLGNIFPGTDSFFTLTPERLVFAAIGIVMLMVVFFALGVEKGKASAYIRPARPQSVIKENVAVPVVPVKIDTAVVVKVKSGSVKTNIMPKISPPVAAIKAAPSTDKTKPYTIVAAAFSRELFAKQEVAKLRTGGLEAFVYYGEPYYLACIGSFQNKESAQVFLKKVKQMRRDAYVRLR